MAVANRSVCSAAVRFCAAITTVCVIAPALAVREPRTPACRIRVFAACGRHTETNLSSIECTTSYSEKHHHATLSSVRWNYHSLAQRRGAAGARAGDESRLRTFAEPPRDHAK